MPEPDEKEREEALTNIIGDRLDNMESDVIADLTDEEYDTLVDSIYNVLELFGGDLKDISQVFSETASALEDLYPSSGEGEDDQQMRDWNPDDE